jgi:signal transduction histidine kinase
MLNDLTCTSRGEEESLSQLRAARDAALLVAQTAIRDTTRLTRLLTILGDQAPLEQLLDHVLSTLSELFSADIVILLGPAKNGICTPLAAIGLPEDILHEPFSAAEGTYISAVMKSLVPVQQEALDADSNIDPQLRDLGAMTGVWLPVISYPAIRGVLILARCTPVPFVRTEVGLLSAMTYRIALSLEQVQKNTELQAALTEVRRLNTGLEQRVEERTAELRLARDAAEAASRAKSAFLAIIGHELRTPLNSIFLAAETLREMITSQAEHREYADIILLSGRRLLQMVQGVIEYTSTDARPTVAALDVATVIRECAVYFERTAARKRIGLTFYLDPDLPPLRGDAYQFDKMLRRLIDNAIKFTPEGGDVTVTARLAESVLRISVADGGVGLRPEDCERIFEPFVQLETSYLEHTEGVGLGLTLARRQAEAYGGRLWAESEGKGKGSCFILVLPTYGTP